HVLLEAVLPARVLAQAAFGILGAHLLQALAARVIALPDEFHLRAAKRLPLAVGRQIDDAQVHAQHRASWRSLWLIGPFAALADVEVVDATPPDQLSTANLPRWVYQPLMLATSQHEAADHTAFQGIEGDPIQAHQPVGAGVVADAPTRTKLGACVPLPLLGFHRPDGLNRL